MRTITLATTARTPKSRAGPKEPACRSGLPYVRRQATSGVVPMIGGGVGFLVIANLNRGSCSGKSVSSPHVLQTAWYEPRDGRASTSQWWATVHVSMTCAPFRISKGTKEPCQSPARSGTGGPTVESFSGRLESRLTALS